MTRAIADHLQAEHDIGHLSPLWSVQFASHVAHLLMNGDITPEQMAILNGWEK